jgi:hypothetical protein
MGKGRSDDDLQLLLSHSLQPRPATPLGSSTFWNSRQDTEAVMYLRKEFRPPLR